MVFLPRTNFLANRSPVRGGVRANSGEPGRTPPNSGERSAYSGERSPEFGGVSVLANRWRIRAEFARVRSSSPEFARVRGERQFAGYTAEDFVDQNLKNVLNKECESFNSSPAIREKVVSTVCLNILKLDRLADPGANHVPIKRVRCPVKPVALF